jgi:hypothetical protein
MMYALLDQEFGGSAPVRRVLRLIDQRLNRAASSEPEVAFPSP